MFSVALALGLAAFTMVEGRAFSYLSPRSEACTN